VDDEALALRILKKYRIANYVDSAKDGEEALKMLKERLAEPGSGGAEGRVAGEPILVPTRAWVHESGSAGSTLPPAAGPERRPMETSPTQLTGIRSTPSNHPSRTARTPELVLLSFDQRKRTALEIVAEMRSLPGMDKVPVAILCRTPEEERLVRESTLPRLSSLSKPIGFFKLLECILRMDMHWFVFSEKP
jgi:hypothetical protein